MVRLIIQAFVWMVFLSQAVWGNTMDSKIVPTLKQARFVQGDIPCLSEFIVAGYPEKGPSTVILKAPPNCVIPWHIHHAEEQLMVISGKLRVEMDSMPSNTFLKGGFALMPGGMKHQIICESTSDCFMFVTFDKAYDICFIDKCPDPSKSCRICPQ